MKKILLVITLCLLSSHTVQAEFKTGNGLVTAWREYQKSSEGKPYNSNDDGFYTGYIAGVYDSSTHTLFRIPDGATLGQACDVVGKWLDRHPEELNKPAHQLVIKALKEAFPTSKISAKIK
ncbi:MAG: Rap1a/Tai family immunity protein [Chlorobiaceae bacterium]